MSKQADGEAMQDLPRLLSDILADLESALNSARNKPAKKLLQERIDRLRSAIDVIAASEQSARSTADTEEPDVCSAPDRTRRPLAQPRVR